MTSRDQQLMRAVRRAYERGRWRYAIRILWVIAPLIGVAMILSRDPLTSLGIGAALMVLVTLARHRGGVFGSAATVGVLAGVPAYLVPLVGGWSSSACGGACCEQWCMALCTSGGLITGVALGIFASKQQNVVLHLGIAIGVSALTAAVGCNAYGFTSLAAMIVVATAMSTSVLILRPTGLSPS